MDKKFGVQFGSSGSSFQRSFVTGQQVFQFIVAAVVNEFIKCRLTFKNSIVKLPYILMHVNVVEFI